MWTMEIISSVPFGTGQNGGGKEEKDEMKVFDKREKNKEQERKKGKEISKKEITNDYKI